MTPKTSDDTKRGLFKKIIKLGDTDHDEGGSGSAEKPSNMIKVGKEIQEMTKTRETLDAEIARLEHDLEEHKEENELLLSHKTQFEESLRKEAEIRMEKEALVERSTEVSR